MSLYTRGEPFSNQQFRQNTEKRAGQMIGVTSTPKKCRCIRCEKHRTEATGMHTKGGFVCHGCKGRK
jgi:late competence protein required for DNA uptake (superfamily II DNA/RNA helicase)